MSPKGVRDGWARVLHGCFTEIIRNPANLGLWARLFILPKCILASPAAGCRLPWREILQRVRGRLQRWLSGEVDSLWSDACADARSLSKRAVSSVSTSSQRSSNARRARLAVQNCQFSKAIQALSSEGLASPSPTVIQEMQDKHPQAPPPTLPPGPTPPSVEVPDRVVLHGVKSFPKDSAPGPSGLRPNHLYEAVCCPSPDRAGQVLTSLTKFVNLLATGRAPCSICPYLCGATLLASRKKNGGLRPITVGEVLRRLISKSLSSATRQEAFNSLASLQQGVSVRGGCEAIIHSVSQLMSSETPEHCWTLLLDFSNAFNSINRESMFVEVRRRIPSLSAWMEFCYSSQPLLYLGSNTIHSCCGVQQGEPLGPLGFSLALHPVVERIRMEVPDLVLNAWYLDDGTLMGSPEDLVAALRIIEDDGPSLGLHLNRVKSLLFIPEKSDALLSSLLSDIPTTRGGFTLLGCPIGPPSYCEEVFGRRVAKVKSSLGGSTRHR